MRGDFWLVSAVLFFALLQYVAADFHTFEEDVLEQHNKLRALHHAPPLELDQGLSKGAEEEAQRNLEEFASLETFIPKDDDDDDKNNYIDHIWAVVTCTKSGINSKQVLGPWIKQEKAYNWTANYFDSHSGQFTQMIWKSTTHLGVGVATGKIAKGKYKYATVVVLRYSPPGNVMDESEFAENVLPVGDGLAK